MSLGCGDVNRTRRIPSTPPGGPQQVGEQRPHLHRVVAGLPGGQLQVTSVAVHVLAEQGDLGDPGGGELLDLGDDVIERPGDLDAAYGRDDAEGAVVVAADLDRDPGVEGRSRGPPATPTGTCTWSSSTAASRISVIGPPARAVRSRSAARCTLCVPITTSTWPAFCRTSSRSFCARHPETDDLPVVALRLPGLELAEVAVEPVVGVLPDAARVEHDDVGLGDVEPPGPARRPRAGRRCARSRARSSGTRTCARRSSGPSRSRRPRLRRTQARTMRPSTTGATGELAAMYSMAISSRPSPGCSTSVPPASTV